ncbi:pentapeptide repeat-containing protein [Rhodococcus sp. SBT000017]|uniref:pentapeptide repeat-containing protein n=1 Tax=Rhodococcus sp. SBT000017 TaxID=1803385 RepID=UPI0011C45885|nr:pentapeptide repeat-containing protein [Rhodococcus sp. SBT000017]
MSLHAQVPTPAIPTVPVESTDSAGIGVWFLDNLTQPAATVLASLGIIVAAIITFAIGLLSRRQLDRHHKATHTLADTQALRGRFTTITAQLADPAPAIRTAAVSALEALADDWLDRDKPRETQACINVLCDYLRTPYETSTRNPHLRKETRRTHRTKYDYTDTTHEYPYDDLDTRHAITRTIAAHLQPHHDHSWSSFDYDLTGAYLHNLNLDFAVFSGKTTSFEDATFSGERTSFFGATSTGKYTSFSGAAFSSKRTNFENVTFNGEYTWFSKATFSGKSANFEWTRFRSSEYTSFSGATFRSEYTTFDRATFSGDYTSFTESTFDGEIISFDEATFSSRLGTTFRHATFSATKTSFENPRVWIKVEMDWDRLPGSVAGPLPTQPASVHPHEWPPVPKPLTG